MKIEFTEIILATKQCTFSALNKCKIKDVIYKGHVIKFAFNTSIVSLFPYIFYENAFCSHFSSVLLVADLVSLLRLLTCSV